METFQIVEKFSGPPSEDTTFDTISNFNFFRWKSKFWKYVDLEKFLFPLVSFEIPRSTLAVPFSKYVSTKRY